MRVYSESVIRGWLEWGARVGALRVLILEDPAGDPRFYPHFIMSGAEYNELKSELSRQSAIVIHEMYDPGADHDMQLSQAWTWIPI